MLENLTSRLEPQVQTRDVFLPHLTAYLEMVPVGDTYWMNLKKH